MLAGPVAGLPGYRWAQHASGAVGLAVVAVAVVRWWLRTPPAPAAHAAGPRARPWPWVVVLGAGLVGTVVGAVSGSTLRAAGFAAVTGGLAAAAACALALCLGWHARRAVLGRRSAGTEGARQDRGAFRQE